MKSLCARAALGFPKGVPIIIIIFFCHGVPGKLSTVSISSYTKQESNENRFSGIFLGYNLPTTVTKMSLNNVP